VKRLPDPSVREVLAPASAAPGAPVTISATVAERNGDVGATVNCVLFLDGVPSAWIPNVWVDAGDRVSCAFTRSFDTIGPKVAEVRVEAANPADWDATNNSARATITVAWTEVPASSHVAHFQDYSSDYSRQEGRRTFTYTVNGITESGVSTFVSQRDGAHRDAFLTSNVAAVLDWPITYAFAVASGGNTLVQGTTTATEPNLVTQSGAIGSACAFSYVQAAAAWIRAQECQVRYFLGLNGAFSSGLTTASASTFTGTVTYIDESFVLSGLLGACPSGCYFAAPPRSDQVGLPLPSVGETVTFDLRLNGADRNVFHGSGLGTWTAFAFGSRVLSDWTCFGAAPDLNCFRFASERTGRWVLSGDVVWTLDVQPPDAPQ
jgi:hypothetical protein